MFFLSNTQFVLFRDDLSNPVVSGNKLHKLTPNISLAKARGCSAIASFGGPYSNHLHALAWACREAGLISVGFIRGELHKDLTPTLQDCQSWGMRLIATQRKTYRELQGVLTNTESPLLSRDFSQPLFTDIPEDALIVPEGGSNLMAIDSVASAYSKVFKQSEYQDVTHAVCATGTGATVAGLYKAAPAGMKVLGIQAVAEGDATHERIHNWLGEKTTDLDILPGHLGGFAKMPVELLTFIDEFESKHNVPLDPVYTGKMMFELSELAEKGFFTASDKVLVIHTGGLQGKRGLMRS